jgi:toxin ParE1/3/4
MAGRKRPVLWSPEARVDLFAIWNYYREEAGEAVADKVVRAMIEKSELLERHPFSGRSRDALRPGMRSLLIDPYVIFYRLQKNIPEIVRVLHGRQDLDDIFSEE